MDQFRATPDAFLGERPAVTPADMEREHTCPMDPEVRQKGPGACPTCGMALEPVDLGPVTKVEWTCPMHPEIVREAPGSCPICGMALEPRTVALEDQNPELEHMTRRFWWSAAITAPILAFMVSEFLPGQPVHQSVPHGWLNWTLLALATPVVLWGGWPCFVRGWASVVNRYLNMFTLIALGEADPVCDEATLAAADHLTSWRTSASSVQRDIAVDTSAPEARAHQLGAFSWDRWNRCDLFSSAGRSSGFMVRFWTARRPWLALGF